MNDDHKSSDTSASTITSRLLRLRRLHIVVALIVATAVALISTMATQNARAIRHQTLNAPAAERDNAMALTSPAHKTASISQDLPLPAAAPPTAPPTAPVATPATKPAANAAAPASPISAKTTAPEPAGSWHNVTVKRGDNLALIFQHAGLSARQLYEVLQLGGPVKQFKTLFPGDTIKLRIDDQHHLLEMVHETDPVHSIHVLARDGGFVAKQISRKVEVRTAYASGEIQDSLFQASQNAGLPDNLTMELASIFGWDIDFALDIRQGDHFTVLYEDRYVDGDKIGTGDIIAAEFTNRGKTYRAIRYVDASGHADYYTPDGHSMRKAFLRTPVKFTRISSRFNLHRMHPILNRIRAHKGVDYAAPRGTPIRVTGDGKVIFKGRKGGYGRVIIVRHGSRYSTLYGHMSAFNRHIRVGGHVNQGQVIGYVGMSGLATGPHLHYEFRINGVHRNPLTVKLPMAQSIAKKYRNDFIAKAAPLVAQLETLDRSRLARN